VFGAARSCSRANGATRFDVEILCLLPRSLPPSPADEKESRLRSPCSASSHTNDSGFRCHGYRIGKAAGEIIVSRFEIFSAVVGNHHAVIIRADENSFGSVGMNGNRIDF
jgi:hypothetical protein